MADFMRLFGAGALAALLLATPALAQDDAEDGMDEVGAWDGDGDGALSEEEFNTGFSEGGAYDEWDADEDGMLSEDEFNAGVFGGYDDDESGVIEEPELGDAGDDMGDGGLFDV